MSTNALTDQCQTRRERGIPKRNMKTNQQTPAKYLFSSIVIVHSHESLYVLLPEFRLEKGGQRQMGWSLAPQSSKETAPERNKQTCFCKRGSTYDIDTITSRCPTTLNSRFMETVTTVLPQCKFPQSYRWYSVRRRRKCQLIQVCTDKENLRFVKLIESITIILLITRWSISLSKSHKAISALIVASKTICTHLRFKEDIIPRNKSNETGARKKAICRIILVLYSTNYQDSQETENNYIT